VSPPVAARQSEAAEDRKPLKTIFGSHLQQAEASIAPRIGEDRLLLCGHFSRLKGWKNAMSTRPDRDGWAKGFIAHFSGTMMHALIFRVSLAKRARRKGPEYGSERATG
jgi:hypothetical protein